MRPFPRTGRTDVLASLLSARALRGVENGNAQLSLIRREVSSKCQDRRWAPLLLGAAVALGALGAAPIQDWSNNVETVVVTAQASGPALWHIVQGPSDVWILPTVSP